MLSRINRETIGTGLILVGIAWLMIIAGADDYNTMQHIATPMISLIGKTLIGFVIIAAGAKISKGGRKK